jgi:hypothetical protein
VNSPREMIADAAQVFLGPIEHDFWYEHGISYDEAEKGAAALLVHLGLLTKEQVQRIESEDANQLRLERFADRLRERDRRAAMDPEMLKMEDLINESMRVTSERFAGRIMDDMFRPSPFFTAVAASDS